MKNELLALLNGPSSPTPESVAKVVQAGEDFLADSAKNLQRRVISVVALHGLLSALETPTRTTVEDAVKVADLLIAELEGQE